MKPILISVRLADLAQLTYYEHAGPKIEQISALLHQKMLNDVG